MGVGMGPAIGVNRRLAAATSPRAALIDFFDVLALHKPPYLGAVPWWTRKWMASPTVVLDNAEVQALKPRIARALARLETWTGLDFPLADGPREPANVQIVIGMVRPRDPETPPSRWDTACFTTSVGERGRLARASVRINAAYPDCIEHELMHAIGFDNHWLAGPETAMLSVLAPREGALRALDYSAWDAAAIRLLYDSRLPPGLMRDEALVLVNRLVAERPNTI
jgi:hypothetical protein